MRDKIYTYSTNKNQRDGFTYDAAGNLTNDQAQTYTYYANGQQFSAEFPGYGLQQFYDGDGLRAQKYENGATTSYVRSSVLGGAVVAEVDASGNWSRGYVYAGGELMSVQQGGQLYWVHEDSVTKSKRITDVYGNVVSTVELDPYGANTNRSNNSAFLPQSFTTYVRDGNGDQDAMARRYDTSSSRFSQPDPYGGSYDFGDPQSLNRYAYTKNDPVNFRDPSGMDIHEGGHSDPPPPTWIVTVRGSWDDMTGYLPDWTSGITSILFLRPLIDPRERGGDIGGAHEAGHGAQTSNPNCIMNAVSGATGLARPFGNVGPTGTIGHDGIHVVAPAGSRVKTLSPLTGTVLGIHNADGGKTHIVDVLLDRGGFVALYKDLVTVNVRPGQHLGVGAVVGTVGAYEGGGLHFALLNGGRQADKYYRSLTSTDQTNKIMVGMFTNPNGPNSPVRCPGVSVNNAGVNPHP